MGGRNGGGRAGATHTYGARPMESWKLMAEARRAACDQSNRTPLLYMVPGTGTLHTRVQIGGQIIVLRQPGLSAARVSTLVVRALASRTLPAQRASRPATSLDLHSGWDLLHGTSQRADRSTLA